MSFKSTLKEAILKVGSRASCADSNLRICLEETTDITQAENTKTSRTFVAPCDGTLFAYLQNSNSQAVVSIAKSDNYRVASKTSDGGVSMDLAKGDSVIILTADEGKSLYQRRINFYKSIGGGWLTRLLNCLFAKEVRYGFN